MNKAVYWSPRILTIFFILFVSLFALDSFDSGKNVAENIAAFLIHLVPSFFLILLLLVAWRYEWIGIIAFAALGITYIIISWGRFPFITYLTISGPLCLISVLFFISWIKEISKINQPIKKITPESWQLTGVISDIENQLLLCRNHFARSKIGGISCWRI